MGTRTLGYTSGPPNNNQFFWIAFSGGDILHANTNPATASEDMYVDGIYFYSGSHTGSQYFQYSLYNKDTGNIMIGTGPSGPYGVGYAFNHGSFAAGDYKFIPAGTRVVAAAYAPNNIQTACITDGGSFDYHTGSGWPNPWSGSTKSGFGSIPWYVTYFPTAQISDVVVGGVQVSGTTQGTRVEIDGRSFSAGITAIDFNGTNVDMSTLNAFSDTGLHVDVPAGATTGPIHIHTNAGTATSGTFYINPTYSNLSSSSGHPGDTVRIFGTGFNSATGVKFAGGVWAGYTVNSDTQITATVPHGAVTGVITVYGGNSSVTTDTYTVLTSISSFSPTAGGIGTSVTINGSGFTGASAVRFNGVNAASFTVNSDTKITAVVAAGSTTGTISVVGTGGTATSTGVFTVASAYVMRTGTWNSGSVSIERSGSETQAQGVLVFRSGAWVSAQ